MDTQKITGLERASITIKALASQLEDLGAEGAVDYSLHDRGDDNWEQLDVSFSTLRTSTGEIQLLVHYTPGKHVICWEWILPRSNDLKHHQNHPRDINQFDPDQIIQQWAEWDRRIRASNGSSIPSPTPTP